MSRISDRTSDWNVAQAKQRLPAVLRATASGPQKIRSRDRLVAVVIDADDFQKFEELRAARPTLAQAFQELRRICVEENYIFSAGHRRDRRNAFVRAVAD